MQGRDEGGLQGRHVSWTYMIVEYAMHLCFLGESCLNAKWDGQTHLLVSEDAGLPATPNQHTSLDFLFTGMSAYACDSGQGHEMKVPMSCEIAIELICVCHHEQAS